MAHPKRYLILLVVALVETCRQPRPIEKLRDRRTARPLLLALLAGYFGFALNSPAQPADDTPILRFTVFSVRPLKNVTFLSRANAAPQEIIFYPTARSPRYEFRGAMPLQFTDAVSGRVVAEVSIPPEMGEALLLFSVIEPVPKSGPLYRVAVLDDSAVRHGPGELAIINFSGLELSGTIGRQTVILKPGLNPSLQVAAKAQITLRTALKGKTYQSYADQLDIGSQERALLVLFPPYYAGSLEVQSRMLIDRVSLPLVPAR